MKQNALIHKVSSIIRCLLGTSEFLAHGRQTIMSSDTRRIASLSFAILDYCFDAIRQCTHVRLFSETDELVCVAFDNKNFAQVNFTIPDGDDCQVERAARHTSVTFCVRDMIEALESLPRNAERVTLFKSGGQLTLEEESIWDEASVTLAPFEFVEEFSCDEDWFARDPSVAQALLETLESDALVQHVVKHKVAHVRLAENSVSLRLPTRCGIKTLEMRALVCGPYEEAQFVLRRSDVAFFDKIYVDQSTLLLQASPSSVQLCTTDSLGVRWVRAFPNANLTMEHDMK
jgi:hypothetical protein